MAGSQFRKKTIVRFQRTTWALFRSGAWVFGRLAPPLAASLLEHAFLTPPRRSRTRSVESRKEPAPNLAAKTPATTPATPGRLHYGGRWLSLWRYGAGPKVLLVHGWGGTARDLDAFIEPLVSAGFEVITFDGPAHGDSDGRRTNLLDFSGAVVQVAGAVGALAGIVAHSFGAPATALALSNGLAARRAVMIASPTSLEDASRAAATMIGFPETARARMQRRVERRLGVAWSELDATTLVEQIRQPLLFVHDRGDRVVDWRSGGALAAAAPSARLVTTAGLGHTRILQAAPVIEDVVDFLQANGEPLTPGQAQPIAEAVALS